LGENHDGRGQPEQGFHFLSFKDAK
jgi:hypothetical protein